MVLAGQHLGMEARRKCPIPYVNQDFGVLHTCMVSYVRQVYERRWLQDNTESRIWAGILSVVRIRKNIFKERTRGDGTMPVWAQYSRNWATWKGQVIPVQLFCDVHVKSSKHELTVCAAWARTRATYTSSRYSHTKYSLRWQLIYAALLSSHAVFLLSKCPAKHRHRTK